MPTKAIRFDAAHDCLPPVGSYDFDEGERTTHQKGAKASKGKRMGDNWKIIGR
jgi:hypothetical protein